MKGSNCASTICCATSVCTNCSEARRPVQSAARRQFASIGLVCVGLLGGCFTQASAPEPANGSPATLARAVTALRERYGDAYRPPVGDAGDFAATQRAALLAHPRLQQHPLLFVVRRQYARDHHNTATFFPKARSEYNDGTFTGGGALKTMEFGNGGRLRTLLEVPAGIVRDPEVDADGQRIVFSMRRDAGDSYHIYTIRADGSELRQLTAATDVDDLDPVWLPDGGIAFTSTREPKYCMCNRHLMANLHRMDGDGANIHQIGKSTLFEGHPTVLADGRLLYDRWEYVDRNFGDAQALWTVNPDGSNHAVYWGNNTPSPGAVIDAREIPGTAQVLCIFASCHERPWGALAIVDRRLGLDGRAPVVQTWPADAVNLVKDEGWEIFDAFNQVARKYEDPYPLDDAFFLCVRMTGEAERTGLYLIDRFGNEVLVHAEDPGCFDPMPLGPRPRPAKLPARRGFGEGEGTFYLADVYAGPSMREVPRGTVKFLRVVESPEKRTWTVPAWNGQGQEAPAMNWHDFNNKRILGTVPVEADGSAYFSVPAERFVYFQLLDARGMLVQSMRSGTMVQPGEHASCIGCHEDRRTAPAPVAAGRSRALSRGPSSLTGWHGEARLFNYRAEVQPVFDRHCVRCHDYGRPEGERLNLAGDRDLVFNTSYNELWRKKWINAVGAGPATTLPAHAWGSSCSRLVPFLEPSHYDVKLSAEEFDRVVTWIDLNAPYYPVYASAHPRNLAGRAPLDAGQLTRLEALTGVPLRSLAAHNSNRGPQVSFDRPALSPCLARLEPGDPKRREALALIEAGRDQLAQVPEADQPGFQACETDRWREELYAARRAAEAQRRAALREGRRDYEVAGSP